MYKGQVVGNSRSVCSCEVGNCVRILDESVFILHMTEEIVFIHIM